MPNLNDTELDLLLRRAGTPTTPPGADAACLSTPEFDLGRVLALGDGADDAEALDHIARCIFCRAMLADVTGAAKAPNDLLTARMQRAWSTETRGVAQPQAVRSTRTLAWGAVGGFVALAAALAILVLRPQSLPPAPEFTLEGPTGGLTEIRADVPESNVFVPASQVRLVLHPHLAPLPGAALALFRVETGERLHRLPDALARVQPNGAWLIEGEGRALFGDTPGPRRLLVVVAGAAEALTDLDGREASALEGRTDLRAYPLSVEYRTGP
jgi:hypothetical protein